MASAMGQPQYVVAARDPPRACHDDGKWTHWEENSTACPGTPGFANLVSQDQYAAGTDAPSNACVSPSSAHPRRRPCTPGNGLDLAFRSVFFFFSLFFFFCLDSLHVGWVFHPFMRSLSLCLCLPVRPYVLPGVSSLQVLLQLVSIHPIHTRVRVVVRTFQSSRHNHHILVYPR